jgi:hypothetical protein
MLANFTGEDSLVKPPQPVDGGSTEGVKQGLTQLYAFLDDKGYAMSTQVVDAGPLSVQVMPPLNSMPACANSLCFPCNQLKHAHILVAFCRCIVGFVADACAPRVSLLQAYSAESARLKRWQALVGAKIPELRGEGFKISVTLKVTP